MNRLVLGNLNYSSWSIRASLVARYVGLPVEEVIIPLDFPETTAKLKEISPTAKVPLLIWDDQEIWESLAITEWIAEWAAPGMVWPEDARARAVARAAACEMHAGFPDLRKHCWMDIRGRHKTPDMTAGLAADIARINRLWSDLRETFGDGGPFLFGKWSAADAFYTPVVTRFRTWGLPLASEGEAYATAVLDDPMFKALEEQATAEPWWINYTPDGRSSGYLKPED